MTDYLDIGVVQIQSWLTRTPKLRGRRGGSTLISQATAPDEVRKVLDGLDGAAEINESAGRIDGVVSLILHGNREPVEQRVVQHLRDWMPAASLSVKGFRGDTYTRARAQDPVHDEEWPAPAADWPAARPCGWCSTLPATSGRRDHDAALCVECAARDEAAGRAERKERVPFAEAELLARLGHPGAAVPDEFPKLAGLDGSETHLALVYADGNAIGRFITERQKLKRRKDKTDYPAAIDDSTWHALTSAVRMIRRDGDTSLPIVPHLVGGDDVLVSVPAHRAWQFAEALLGEFHDRLGVNTGATGIQGLPTLSAGIVFHHYAVPLFQVNELAKSLLRRAKVRTSGKAASLAWHDTTRDGREPIDRDAITLQTFQTYRTALSDLAALKQSARQRLADLTRTHGGNSAEVAAHAARVGSTEVLEPFGEQLTLADALGMTWWWHDPA
ncbi:hypothetical protein INP57_22730 [Saccharopolyspora sp. HNM0986]|uniref:Cas10/Cmr2 second palm domain-containing protein n=1 Tax=Saccharopolyspora galaxeae TaxID=2781241 RepID=UPI00190E2C89|nr:hypothetical protein [Saccharopolyspora sp. HNM0986]MBK0869634.1 hypothetical protein [Saccharopolyspora sp. HNM0986]